MTRDRNPDEALIHAWAYKGATARLEGRVQDAMNYELVSERAQRDYAGGDSQRRDKAEHWHDEGVHLATMHHATHGKGAQAARSSAPLKKRYARGGLTTYERSLMKTQALRDRVAQPMLALFDHVIRLANSSYEHGYKKRAGIELSKARKIAGGL